MLMISKNFLHILYQFRDLRTISEVLSKPYQCSKLSDFWIFANHIGEQGNLTVLVFSYMLILTFIHMFKSHLLYINNTCMPIHILCWFFYWLVVHLFIDLKELFPNETYYPNNTAFHLVFLLTLFVTGFKTKQNLCGKLRSQIY